MLAFLQKYGDISGYARAHKLHEESLKRMFTNDQSVFMPLMEPLLDTEVWVDEEAPEIIRPYCEYIAKLEEEPADTKSQEIRKQVKHLQRRCTNILLMASQLSKKHSDGVSLHKESGTRKGGAKVYTLARHPQCWAHVSKRCSC